MNKNLTCLLLLFPLFLLAQETKLNSVYAVDISNIGFMKVVKGPSGYYGAKEGYKYIVIEGMFHSKSTRRVELPLYRMFIKTETERYMGLGDPSYIPFSEKDRFIKFKKKGNRSIYFEVKEDFKEGLLIFDQRGIGKIRLMEDGVTATLVPMEE